MLGAPTTVTPFHHQPEAQHLKSLAIHKNAGRLPHLWVKSRHRRMSEPCPLYPPKRTSVSDTRISEAMPRPALRPRKKITFSPLPLARGREHERAGEQDRSSNFKLGTRSP